MPGRSASISPTSRSPCAGATTSHRSEVPVAYRPFLSAACGRHAARPRHGREPRGRRGSPNFDNAPDLVAPPAADGLPVRTFSPLTRNSGRSLFLDSSGWSRRSSPSWPPTRIPFVGPTLELITILRLARQDGIILHGCGIEHDGRGTGLHRRVRGREEHAVPALGGGGGHSHSERRPGDRAPGSGRLPPVRLALARGRPIRRRRAGFRSSGCTSSGTGSESRARPCGRRRPCASCCAVRSRPSGTRPGCRHR